MLKLTSCVLIGICLGLYFNIALFLFLLIFYSFIKKEKIHFVIIIVFLVVNIGEYKYNEVSRFIKNNQENNIKAIAKIVSNVEEKEYTNKYIIKIKKWNFNYNNLKFILYTEKDIILEYGDIIQINGNFENASTARNYKGFDYSRYLRQNKIYGICNSDNINTIGKEKDINNYIYKLKSSCSQILDSNFGKRESGFLKGILLGDMSNISADDKSNFQKSNLAHIVAISGMHVSYIIIVVDFILKRVIFSAKLKNYIEIVFLISFMIFTGASVSCMRAVMMMILILISKIIYRKNDFYSSLLFSFCVVLIYSPYNIEAVGMWLSFLGTLGLMLFNKKITNYVLANLYSSFVVQLLIFPIIAYCYNSFSLTFFISNFLVSIFIAPVLILGYLSIFLYKFKPLIIIENILIKIIFKVSEFVSHIKVSNILVVTPSLIAVFIYYIILIDFINKKKIRKVYIIFIIILLIGNVSFNDKCEIHFLDVGQGDCTYISLPNGKNILIDGGENLESFDYGKRVIAPYLLDKKIIEIDYMIISHFDLDHVGGLFYIVENFRVNNILIGLQFVENDNLKHMQNMIEEKNINLIILEKGDKLKLAEDVYIDVLFPISNEEIRDNSINNNSLVFKFIFENIDILFTGDIEKEAEEKIVKLYGKKLKCNILKVAHHGSITSSTEDFIKYVSPQIALIGVGENNNFGHPSDIVLKRLNDIKCKTYRTDLNGEISISLKNKKIVVENLQL